MRTNIEILESVNIKHKELKQNKPLLLFNILKAMDVARSEQLTIPVSIWHVAFFGNGLYTLLYTVLFLSVGKLFLHKNKIFTINTCVYHIYNIYLYCCNEATT